MAHQLGKQENICDINKASANQVLEGAGGRLVLINGSLI